MIVAAEVRNFESEVLFRDSHDGVGILESHLRKRFPKGTRLGVFKKEDENWKDLGCLTSGGIGTWRNRTDHALEWYTDKGILHFGRCDEPGYLFYAITGDKEGVFLKYPDEIFFYSPI